MRIEFQYWPGNVQVELVDDLGQMAKSFYTQTRRFLYEGLSSGPQRVNAEAMYETLYELLSPPVIGGELGHLHEYWTGHPEQANRSKQGATSDLEASVGTRTAPSMAENEVEP